MMTIRKIGYKSCLRCRKSIPLIDEGTICKQCQSFIGKIEYKKETKKKQVQKEIANQWERILSSDLTEQDLMK